jgi:hypothetical protein
MKNGIGLPITPAHIPSPHAFQHPLLLDLTQLGGFNTLAHEMYWRARTTHKEYPKHHH